jgi:hypothetical protein
VVGTIGRSAESAHGQGAREAEEEELATFRCETHGIAPVLMRGADVSTRPNVAICLTAWLGWSAAVPDKTDRTSLDLFATRATSGPAGSLRRDVARSAMPARQEPRVDAEPHGGPPAVTDPDRFRPQPPELG